MATEKLSTAEILALARQQGALGAEGGSSTEAAASEPDAEAPAAETPPAAEKPKPKAPAAKPTSTADILAAARAQGGTGGADAAEEESKPAPAAAKPAAAPKSTTDILAAARAQGGTAGGAAPKAAAGGGAPKSTADILAAARAQKGGGAAAKPAAPKTAKPVAAPKAGAAATAVAGEHPSVQEMVRAMHEGGGAGATATAVAPARTARPKLPGKPPLPPKKDSLSRRAALGAGLAGIIAILMTPFAMGWIVMGMLGGLWTLLGARFMMPNMVVELPSKFKVGPPSDFPEGAVSTKFKASRGVWIVNSSAYNGEQLIYALISVCTHLGCTPNWLEGEQKFKCPCHGSGFYISGINFEGPAPRPLERAGIRLAEDGSLEVDKSVKFQEELGQWQDAKSFYQA